MASIKGKVIEQSTEGADEHLKKLAEKYLGIGRYYYRKPSHKRVILMIKPEKVLGLSIISYMAEGWVIDLNQELQNIKEDRIAIA